jgi:hypothetical protein
METVGDGNGVGVTVGVMIRGIPKEGWKLAVGAGAVAVGAV